jgi:predicted dehydrogenase
MGRSITSTENLDCRAVRSGRSRPAGSRAGGEWGVAYFADHGRCWSSEAGCGDRRQPNNLHVSTALDCLAAGVPVLLEKPVGVHLDEVRKLVEASNAAACRCWSAIIGGTIR